MRIAATLIALAALATFGPAELALAQGYGSIGSGPKLGQMEIRAYQKIPKTKIAVQLTSDTHLSRELRRQVMVRLSQRGNEVGFSGGNIMRMDVSYFDFSAGTRNDGWIDPGPSVETGANPRLALPSNPIDIGRRGSSSAAPSSSTLRVSLTLYEANGGKVLWTATASCSVPSTDAKAAGLGIVNQIFDNADANRIADSAC